MEMKQMNLVKLIDAVQDIKEVIKKYNLTLADINQVLSMVIADDKFFGNPRVSKSQK